MKNIKCEWCGTSYDLDETHICPKCGSSTNLEGHLIKGNKLFKISKNVSKKFNFTFKFFLIFGFLIIFAIVVCIYLAEIDFTFKKEKEVYYLENNQCIETNFSKFYIPSFYVFDDFIDDYKHLNFNVCIEKENLDEHIINIYLCDGDYKYRFVNFSSNYKEDITSLNEIFKEQGIYSFIGGVNTNGISDSFDKLIIEIDGISYSVNLISNEHIIPKEKNKTSFKVNLHRNEFYFGDGNYLDINNIILN